MLWSKLMQWLGRTERLDPMEIPPPPPPRDTSGISKDYALLEHRLWLIQRQAGIDWKAEPQDRVHGG